MSIRFAKIFLLSVIFTSCGSFLFAEKVKVPVSYRITITEFQFEGNTVFSDQQLQELLSEFTNSQITIDKIHEAKELITKLYISSGYVNSGAILPDQKINDGVIKFTIVEGKLSKVTLAEGSGFHPSYISGRINAQTHSPLHFPKLQLPLYLLNLDPSIEHVHAELTPTNVRGEGELKLKIDKASPYRISFGIDNHKSPNVGDLQRYVNAELRNLSGWNEITGFRYANTNGLRDYGGYFSIPINYADTRLILNYQDSSSTIIDDIFKDLDIDSSSEVFDVGLRHPVFRDHNSELAFSVKLTLKRNETTLMGMELDDGASRRTILSLGQEWIDRSSKHALTIRSTFDISTSWLNATITDYAADGEFFAWLGQIQWLRRLPFLHSQLLFKTNVRLTDDEVPASEKFAVGGYSTVRGYRENALTGDQGFTSALELQMVVANLKFPGLSDGPEDGDLYLIPFIDFGKVWNKELDVHNTDIGSVGLGLRWIPRQNSRMEIFWGHALRDLPEYSEYSLQDDGIHFNFNLTF